MPLQWSKYLSSVIELRLEFSGKTRRRLITELFAMFCEVAVQGFCSLFWTPWIKEKRAFSQKDPAKLSELLGSATRIRTIFFYVLRFLQKGMFMTSNTYIALKCCIFRDYTSAKTVSASCKFYFFQLSL